MAKIEWLSVKQITDLSGTCDKTVRRHVKAGKYRSKYVEGKFGPELRIAKEDVLKAIQVSATPGQRVKSAELSPAKSKVSGATPGQPENNLLRVVIVDDSDELVGFLTNQLKKLKVEVAGVAKDGVRALELIEAEKPDLVIAEVALPGIMDGFQLAQKKAKNKKIRSVPLVFLSFLKERTIIQEARQCSKVSAYFCKPLIGSELVRFKTWIREMKKQSEAQQN